MIIVFLKILTLIIILECLFQIWVNKLRKIYDRSYNWHKPIITNIITKKKDNPPRYTKDEFLKHMMYFYDKDLGTNNKPNTNNVEIFYDGKKKFVSNYSIGKFSERKNQIFKKNEKISSYGDSLCFGRFVDDNKTWQYQLSKKIRKNVQNFGVGNYGLDQAFLKYKNNKKQKIDKSNSVIFLFGPEVLRRNLSIWKHFYEFGNIFNTKPAFIYNKYTKKFELIKNPNCKKLHRFDFELLKKKIIFKDFFYESKFSKYLWSFPYILSLKRYPIRKIILLLFFTYIHLKKKYKFSFNFIENKRKFKDFVLLGGLYFDFIDKVKMYKQNFALNSLANLIFKISNYCKKNNTECYFFLVPSYYDLKFFQKNKKVYYNELNKIIHKKKSIKFFDLTKELGKHNSKKIYADKAYGGHLNIIGQKNLSEIILKLINEKKK